MAQSAHEVNTAAIRLRIERTRADLSHTIDAIQERLSPRRVVQDAKDAITDATIGRARRLAHRVTEAMESGEASSNVSAALDRARRDPASVALIGTAASALLAALISRSRHPRLATGLGGLALSLAVATLTQHRQRGPQLESDADPLRHSPAGDALIGYETQPAASGPPA